jgi:2'-hydroxyisoflavone reductase
VRPWTDMPVWVPPARSPGFARRSIARALAKGLTFRPLADTTAATLEFYEQQTEERKAQLRAGLAADREKELLAAWRAKTKTT